MKNVANNLENYLNTHKNITSCDLYELRLENGASYYYADFDVDVVYDGRIYKHDGLLIKREQIKINDRVVVDTLNVTINTTSPDKIADKPILVAANEGILDGAKLFLKRCFFDDAKQLGCISLFGGICEVKQCGGLELKLTVKAKTQGLSQEFPRRKFYPQGSYSTTDGQVTASSSDNESCVITPFIPLKEVLL